MNGEKKKFSKALKVEVEGGSEGGSRAESV